MRLRRRHRVGPLPGARCARLPLAAVLSHDLARATAAVAGRPVTLDDLEATDRIARLLVDRWQPRQS
jgi:hypothetical protein